MKIVLFVNRDLEANLAFNILKEELLKHDVCVYYSQSVGSKLDKPKELEEIEYYEKNFIYDDLAIIINKYKIKTSFEFFDESFSTFKISSCNNPNASEFVRKVRAFEPDLFISIRYGKIFRDEIIKIPKKGIINLHSAILPHYRGILGTLHNLKEGKKEYGVTLHYITNRGIDTGELIAIKKQKIVKGRSLLWHIVQLYPVGCDLIIKSIRKLETLDKLPTKPQDLGQGAYFSSPIEEDFKKLKAQGFTSFSQEDYQQLLSEYISPQLQDLIF